MTTVYIVRHSQPFRNLLGNYNVNENEQIKNEKNPLSIEGEQRAKAMSELDELKHIDVLYSSHYVRALCTAKYIAENNDIVLNVDERFGERRFGVKSMDELPKTFFEDQFRDWDYKLPNGESANEVSKRMNEALSELLSTYKDKNIVVVSHGTALSTMLSKWCNIELNESTKKMKFYFDNQLVFDGNWDCPELFRLLFDDNNRLIKIENIKKQY